MAEKCKLLGKAWVIAQGINILLRVWSMANAWGFLETVDKFQLLWNIVCSALLAAAGYVIMYSVAKILIAACEDEKPEDLVGSFYKAASVKEKSESIISNGGWRCPGCGKVNSQYLNTCACGVDKISENT